jgi:uncharacterized protein
MVDLAGAHVVAVLTRAPSSPGKTRLFAALGCEPDARLRAALLLDTIDAVMLPGVRCVVAVTPASHCAEVAAIVPSNVAVIPQADGDLGDRMRAVFAALFEAGAGAVAVVGSDLPEISPRVVAQAFEVLDRDREALVLGPATDGGYYLIAATQIPPVFDGMAWSTATVLTDTMAAARIAGIRVTLLELVSDVDTADDLRRVAAHLPHSRTAGWKGK